MTTATRNGPADIEPGNRGSGMAPEQRQLAGQAYLRPAWITDGLRGAVIDAAVMSGIVLAIAAAIALLGDSALQRAATHAAIMIVAVTSLQVFSGNTGIVSFGHAAFIAFGAYAVGLLTISATLQSSALPDLPAVLAGRELGLGAAMAIAAVAVLAAGLVFGTVVRRLSGVGASIATLALLIIVYTVLVGARDFTRGSQPFYGVPRGVGLWLAATVAALTLSAARIFRETAWGLTARAVADDASGAASAGVDERRARFAPWIASVPGAAVAGGLLAQFLGAFSPHTFYFELTFLMLAMLIVGGIRSTWGALAGVVAVSVLMEVSRRVESGGELLGIAWPSVFGMTQGTLAVAMLLVIWRRPEGLVKGYELRIARLLRRHRRPASSALPARESAPVTEALEAVSLTKRYGGLVAVNDVSMTLNGNVITGIIGPNGAGKTTLIDLISGHTAPTSGGVSIGGRPLTRLAAYEVSGRGIARTFQQCRVFSHMTVFENVLVAARMAGVRRVAADAAAWRQLVAVGIEDFAERDAGHLPPGVQRYLEIARALASNPRFLLLDEPAAGLNTAETARLKELILEVHETRGIGIVLIEHDMSLVMSVCDRILVLDRGSLIADGTPADVQANEQVVAAYLGTKRSDGPQIPDAAFTPVSGGI